MKKILMGLIAAVMGASVMAAPVMAACAPDDLDKGCVNTAILGEGGCYCPDESGNSVLHIVQLVVDIMSVGVGILGVLGITIVGIQYLTAGGSEEKTRKAKRRMLEIVIGLVAYAVSYAFLKWLLPSF